MAENESLDLADPGGQRWRHVLDAVRKCKTSEAIAEQIELKLPKALRKAFKEFLEQGVSFEQLLENRNDQKELQEMARQCGSHEYANLFAETAAISGGKTNSEMLISYFDSILDRVADQITHQVAGREWASIPDLQALFRDVRCITKQDAKRLAEKLADDPTQRSRAFLFMAAGAATAFLCRSSDVEVHESGIGAINLPLMTGMNGSRTTRSTHPEFLRRMPELVSTVASRTIIFSLPFWGKTKAQMTRQLADAGLHELAKATVSCVSYPLRSKQSKQCGICPACIFRRQAMLTAGIIEGDNTYKYDLFSATDVVKQPSMKHLTYLKAFLMQIAELQQVQAGRRLPDRVLRHLMGTGLLTSGQSSAHFIRLLSEYRQEWLHLARQAERRGYSWTKLISSSGNTSEGVSHASA